MDVHVRFPRGGTSGPKPCSDGLIGTGPFPGHTGLIAGQSGIPPVISTGPVHRAAVRGPNIGFLWGTV